MNTSTLILFFLYSLSWARQKIDIPSTQDKDTNDKPKTILEYESENQDPTRKHHHKKIPAGTYYCQKGTTVETARLEQLILEDNGWVYYYSSDALVLPKTEGSFIPGVGSWGPLEHKVQGGDHVIRVIGANYFPDEELEDLQLWDYWRLEWYATRLDDTQFVVTYRVVTQIDLAEDPWTSAGWETNTSSDPWICKRTLLLRH